jgi:hypothetical protein
MLVDEFFNVQIDRDEHDDVDWIELVEDHSVWRAMTMIP